MHYKLIRIVCAIRRFYYRLFHGITISMDQSMLPHLGKGKYVSVYRRGDYMDLVDEKTGDFVRMVPYQPNHGYMVEVWRDGKCISRRNLGYEELKKHTFADSEGLR